jgi:hypothetical protein
MEEVLNISIRLRLYALLFALVVVGDAVFYRLQGEQGIINWQSLVHAGWAVLSALLLLAFAFSGRPWMGYMPLTLHFAVFLLSLMNQFFPFSETLNYYCMLFNLGMFTVYYFSVGRRE